MKMTIAAGLTLLCCLVPRVGMAQMELRGFSAQDVKQGLWTTVSVDSLMVSSTTRAGVVRTTAEMVLTAAPYTGSIWNWETGEDAGFERERILDSIELSLWFTLPGDVAVSDLYLWVAGEPQRGYVQDRALAAAQYNEIVGQRLDPALLQYNGNGNWSLRIFPAVSKEPRRVSLTFEHALHTTPEGVASATLPVQYRAQNYWRKNSLGYALFSLDAPAGYTLTVPGAGSARTSASRREVRVEVHRPDTLAAGTITTAAPCASDALLWKGRDRDMREVAGFSVLLHPGSIELEPPPSVRTVVFDVRTRVWDWNDYHRKQALAYGYTHEPYQADTVNVLLRAQKMAVLALRQYAQEGTQFNVVFAGATPQALFETPVASSPQNLAQAFAAIASAQAQPDAQTADAVALAASLGGRSAIILISDLFEPPDYYTTVVTGGWRQWEISAVGTRYDDRVAAVRKAVEGSRSNLFTISDSRMINGIAHNSGGMQLASLLWEYRTWWYGDASRTTIAGLALLPELYGESRYRTLSGIDVAVRGLDASVWSQEARSRYWWWGGDVFVEPAVMMKQRSAPLARRAYWYPPGSDTARIVVAGFTQGSSPVSAVITGYLGGLSFTSEVATCAFTASPRLDSVVGWAWRASEYLAAADLKGNRDSIKALGHYYHLATRQTSLLALEPWMELWEDSTAQESSPQEGRAEMMTASLSADGSGAPDPSDEAVGGVGIDDVSLEDLITGALATHSTVTAPQALAFTARLRRDGVVLTLPADVQGGRLTLTVLDLAGRSIVRHTIESVAGSSEVVVPLGRARTAARATWVIVLETANRTLRTTIGPSTR